MKHFGLAAMTAIALTTASGAASAASFISGPGAVSLDRTDDFSWTVNFTASSGDDLPGTAGKITFNYLSANMAGTLWNFSYSLDNISIAPSAASRLGVFGFNTSGTPSDADTPDGQRFDANLSGGNFNGLGDRDVCFFSGPNCNGSGGSGVTVAESPINGSFSLSFAPGAQTLVLDSFAARWQATGARANGSNSGAGTITAPVPEPASWALMIGGFGLVGGALRRRRPLLATA